MTITPAERESIALIVNVASVCGVEHVADILRRTGHHIDELGHVVEKIGECDCCKVKAHVILNKRSGEFLCLLCRIDSLEPNGRASRIRPGDAGTVGEGAVASAALEPANHEEVTQ